MTDLSGARALFPLFEPWMEPRLRSGRTAVTSEREKKPGNDLLSHSASRAVPSARTGLTSVFGMGTGVSPSLESPGFYSSFVHFEERPFSGDGLPLHFLS